MDAKMPLITMKSLIADVSINDCICSHVFIHVVIRIVLGR